MWLRAGLVLVYASSVSPVRLTMTPTTKPALRPEPTTKPLRNTRHEAFAQALAKGMTADTAYRMAGYRAHRGSASRLRANANIQRRVAEITANAAVRAEVTKADVLRGLMREAGMIPEDTPKDSNASARIAALRLLGLELGMFAEKREHDVSDKLAEAMRTARPLPICMTPPPVPRPQ